MPPKNAADLDEEFKGEEEAIPMDHLITLLQLRHSLTSQVSTQKESEDAKAAIMKIVKEHNMSPYMRLVSESLGWTVDEEQLRQMDETNAKTLAELDTRIKDAEENLGDIEVREGLLAKCDHYARIGDVESCIKFNEECSGKTLAAGPKLDLCFQRIRIGLAFSDNDIAAKGIRDAHHLMKDGDWERRNRLKVYEGLYHVFIRDFTKGSQLLLDSVTTFASSELIDFKTFILITMVASLPVLDRADLKKRIVDSPEVISAQVTDVYDLVSAIYSCHYHDVFPALDTVCQHLRHVVYLSMHVNYFFREVRVLVFNQFLDSYSSVTLKSMSSAFGIPEPVLDQMLVTLISNERVNCKMDRVSGSVKTYRGDTANYQYHQFLKSGDLLLNRIQKLSRLIEM